MLGEGADLQRGNRRDEPEHLVPDLDVAPASADGLDDTREVASHHRGKFMRHHRGEDPTRLEHVDAVDARRVDSHDDRVVAGFGIREVDQGGGLVGSG